MAPTKIDYIRILQLSLRALASDTTPAILGRAADNGDFSDQAGDVSNANLAVSMAVAPHTRGVTACEFTNMLMSDVKPDFELFVLTHG